MPRAEENDLPRGQRRGAVRDQRAFLSETSAAVPPPEPEEPIPVEGFGDAAEILFAPSQRPAEAPDTEVGPTPDADFIPDHYVALRESPNISPETRSLLSVLTFIRAANGIR